MKRQTILWTVAPNGVQNGKLRFSVVVSMRLAPPGQAGGAAPTLAQFPDLVDWPRTIASIRFTLQTDSGYVAPGLVPLAVSERSSAFWQALFPASMEVRPFAFQDYSQRPVRSYPASQVEAMITSRYSKLAVAPDPTQPPDVSAMRQMFSSMAMTSDQRAQMRTLQNGMLAQQKLVGPSDDLELPEGMGPDQWMLVQADAFHRADADPRRPPLAPPKIEFHDLISALGQYPTLMRRLGLIFDVETPAPADWGKVVGVIPEWRSALPAADRSDVSVQTHLDDVDLRSFRPLPEENDEFRAGVALLNERRLFQTTQLEVGTTALGAMEFAAYVSEKNEEYLAPPPPDRPYGDSAQGERWVGVPSLRSEGIALNRNDVAQSLRGDFLAAQEQNQGFADNPDDPFILLYARHLVRGYRVDVREVAANGSGLWRSLCRRKGAYRFVRTGQTWDASEDEGWISLGVSEPTAPPVAGETRIHDTIFRWTGWSLCVSRPGNALLPDGAVAGSITAPPGQDLLRVDFAVPPGSLPPLRFGRRYQLRARVVDLAGNSFGWSDGGDFGATEPIRYARYQPVSSPHVALRQAVTNSPGESVDRVVIRTAFNEQGAVLGVPQPSERHIVPPRTAPQIAEWHGSFDNAQGVIDPRSYDLIAAKQGSLNELHPEEQIALPYLPDPIARGASLVGLPGIDEGLTRISFWPAGAAWPEGKSFRIRLAGGDTPPQWDEARRVLSVFLPPAETAEVDLSAFMDEADLDLMGVWQWVEERDPPNKAELRRRALQGCHWMVTPCRRLTLVHAVQQPLVAPSFRQLFATRGPGDTGARLVDTAPMPIDGKSTLQVDIEARWRDPVDRPTEPAWGEIPTEAHAATLSITRGQTLIPFVGQVRHELGDTRRRRVSYRAVATTRFREYFPFSGEEIRSGARSITRRSEEVVVDVPSSAPPLAPEVLYVVPTFGWAQVRRGSETVHVRRGNGLRVFLKRGWFSSGEGELLGVVFQQEGQGGFPFVGMSNTPMEPLVTQWGADPIWNVGPGAGPSWNDLQSSFKSAQYLGQNLMLREAENDVALRPVAVAGHEVHLDTARNLLYCDIEVDTRAFYMPFVRLALARVQPHSVADMHLSPIVRTDFIQLTPDRVASVVLAPHGGTATVTVTGIGPTSEVDGNRQFWGQVEVELQTRIEGMPDDELAWRMYTEFLDYAIFLEPQMNAGEIRWTGTVSLPGPQERPRDLRLAVREYETLDPTGALETDNVSPVRRLIYADSIPLFGSGTR